MTTESSDALLAWFEVHAREMPWRGLDDPYAVLVCEVMSQQTRIDTVREYWARWMRVFPTLSALADADIDEVMRMWAGLGYYRRARNLHACAVAVVEAHHGSLPTTAAELATLPGIGPYTAAAIASIVHGEPVLAVDGNVNRVVARWAAIDGDPTRAAFRRRVREAASSLLNVERAGDSNEAMMELGATVCTPRNPLCAKCPIAWSCEATKLPDPTVYPEPKERKPPRAETRTCIVITCEGAVLMRRGEQALLGGLWEVPTFETADVDTALKRVQLDYEFGEPARRCGSVVHVFSHIKMTYQVARIDLHARLKVAEMEWVMVSEVDNAGLSAAMLKVIRSALADCG